MDLIALPHPVVERLRHSHWRVLITGASGWLGCAAVEALANALGPLWSDRVVCFGRMPRTLLLRGGTRVPVRPLADLAALKRQPSLLLHFAYLTRERTPAMPRADYVAANRALMRATIEHGTAAGVERVFYTSSGAVYAALEAPALDDPSLLYGRLKLEDEAACEQWAHEHARRRVLVARLFNLSGPYINKPYALKSFIEQALRAGAINIQATRPVVRSYVSASDLLGAALGHLLAEEAPAYCHFDTAGRHEVEMQSLAEAVRDVIAPDAAVLRAMPPTGAADRYVGEPTAWRALLGRHGIAEHDLARQIADTAEGLHPCTT